VPFAKRKGQTLPRRKITLGTTSNGAVI
jgi:hypothetical protein